MEEKVFRETRIQIGILKSRGVIIKNKKYAKALIRRINYYNLINGYKKLFLQTSTPYEQYINGTRIEEIYAMYEFDRNLRTITLEFILEIEKQAKALIAYCFSKEHGHKDYLKYENFEIGSPGKYKQVSDLLSNFYKKISSNIDKEPSITHYVNDKNYIPLWVLVNTVSMGDISKFYANMLPHDRVEVAKRFKWGLRENQLSNGLSFLSSIRNRCAHDELLYDYSSHVRLRYNTYLSYFHIRNDNANNYFSVMIAFRLLLSTNRYIEYHTKIEHLFDDLSTHISTISIGSIRSAMGFPNNWRRLKYL